MKKFRIEIVTEIDSKLIQLVYSLEQSIFSHPMSLQEIDRELNSKYGLIVLIAYADDMACGYKIGYEQSPKRFYSWIGGVVSTHRKLGVAKALMEKQHLAAKEKGYKYITTQTKNNFKEMLILNIKSGFEINGVRKSLDSEEPAILMEKAIF